jgi:peptidoglycan/LPS O-acetylase OafA/YrhL
MDHTPGLNFTLAAGMQRGTRAPAHHTPPKHAYIDALRGYAVLLVITCHTGRMFGQLPYPVKKLTNVGWHGVQLFFLMSCVTLLLSWRSDEAKGRASTAGFWTRRFFRIAPMYYLAAIFYYVIETPKSGFDPIQLLATLGFVNAWHPLLIPTVPDRWMVVPGGWSIGVECTFYVLFPVMALLVRSMRAALVFLVVTLVIGCIANAGAAGGLQAAYGPAAAQNFLYFWFPNQLPVFALGTILYFTLGWLHENPGAPPAKLLRRAASPLTLVCVATGMLIANLKLPQSLPFAGPLFVPSFLLASLAFMVFALILALNPASRFINRPIRVLGQVSFSAYLLHFSVLHQATRLMPAVFDVQQTGWRAILGFIMLWAFVVPVTFALSWLTFRCVEMPMIGAGRALLSRDVQAQVIGAAPALSA